MKTTEMKELAKKLLSEQIRETYLKLEDYVSENEGIFTIEEILAVKGFIDTYGERMCKTIKKEYFI